VLEEAWSSRGFAQSYLMKRPAYASSTGEMIFSTGFSDAKNDKSRAMRGFRIGGPTRT
jgi:hypothetical protein